MHRDITTASENWASAAHYGLIHNGHPTYRHLQEVVATLLEIEALSNKEVDDELVAAAWMHDTLKYTATTPIEIGRTLSRRVGRICELTTDPGARELKGLATPATRAAVKQAAYAEFQAEPNQSIREAVALVRCCDRFCNQRSAIAAESASKIDTYLDEFADFMRVYGSMLIASPGHSHRVALWDRLIEQHAELALAKYALQPAPAATFAS